MSLCLPLREPLPQEDTALVALSVKRLRLGLGSSSGLLDLAWVKLFQMKALTRWEMGKLMQVSPAV